MEQTTWNRCASELEKNPERPVSLTVLASVRSLIVNPSTSDSTVSAISAVLIRFLRLNDDPQFQTNVVHLSLDLAIRFPQHRRQIFDSIVTNRLYAHDSTRLAAESLSALVSISEVDESFRPAVEDLGCDNLFVILCFRPDVAVRAWLLSNFERFSVRPCVMITVFLGFTKDPYPNVRRIALDGMVKLSKFIESDEDTVANGCYCRAVELLEDSDDCVRISAVRAVYEWGQMLVSSSQNMKKSERSDTLFIQLCSMVRDMNAHVRIEAFNCVANIESVTAEILLQSISKKILMSTKNKKALNHLNSKQLQKLSSSAAGAYAHGFEDDYSEVRNSACRSLQKWTIISPEFSSLAVNWLVDVLNDNSLSVRQSALDTMHHMAVNRCLKLQDVHLHMFLGTLEDMDLSIRSITRKVLRMIKFSKFEMFSTAVDGIVKSLENYSQDEADVISTIFTFGKNHGEFVIGIINKITEEVALLPDGKIRPNSGRVTALLALAISAPLSNNQYICKMPPTVYSYAFTSLRRLSSGLINIMDESILLAQLVKCSALTCSSMEFKEGESFLSFFNPDSMSHSSYSNLEGFSDEPINSHQKKTDDDMDSAPASSEKGLEMCDKVAEYAQVILGKFEGIWLLIQSGCTDKAFSILRGFKKEIHVVINDTQECGGTRFFLLQYVHVIELVANIWERWVHSHPERKRRTCSLGELNIVLEKLELTLREMRYRLVGLSCQEEVHILELGLLNHVLRLSSIDLSSLYTSLTKLSDALACMENLIETGSIGPSKFIIELRKSLSNSSRLDEDSAGQNVFKKLLNLFFLRPPTLCTGIRLLKAELDVPGNSSENPLPFVAGLPIGVPLKVTLYNISRSINLWVKMTMKMDCGTTQFVYLDHNHFKDCCEVTNFMCTLPFYNAPKTVSFILMVSVGVECIHEKKINDLEKHMQGPKCDLAYLCQDIEISFSSFAKDN